MVARAMNQIVPNANAMRAFELCESLKPIEWTIIELWATLVDGENVCSAGIDLRSPQKPQRAPKQHVGAHKFRPEIES